MENGVFDTNYNNLILYNGIWYYVDHGQIDLHKTTLSQVNGSGTWYYVENGQLNWSYNGTYNYNGINYIIRNGIVC